jgi:hypothetical protein
MFSIIIRSKSEWFISYGGSSLVYRRAFACVMKRANYLRYYATKFDTVEVDSTFYHSPSVSTVKGWNAKTPPGFIFARRCRTRFLNCTENLAYSSFDVPI